MRFKTNQAQQAYDELVAIALEGKQDVVGYIQEAMDENGDITHVMSAALNNAKVYAENMALAIETAARIDREEYALECAISEQYGKGDLQ